MEEKLEKIAETQELILDKLKQLDVMFGLPQKQSTPQASPYAFGIFPRYMPQPHGRRHLESQDNSLTEQNLMADTESRNQAEPVPLPLRNKYPSLPSSDIPKQLLRPVDEVLGTVLDSKREIEEEKAGTITQMLARESIFGEDVMKRCTPSGSKGFPALPKTELFQLKTIIFRHLPKYLRTPEDFETLWKSKCSVAIEQACRRLRRTCQ